MLKKDNNNYLNFTRKEKNGTLAILAVVLLLLLIPFLYPFIFKEKITSSADYAKELDSLKILKSDSTKSFYKNNFDDDNYPKYYPSSNKEYSNNSRGELFYFDPNTLSVDGWVRLGLREKTANSIQKYLSKGGKFRQAADIKKIWGLRPELVERILPYVKIASTNNATQYENKNYPAYEKKVYEKKIIEPVDINHGDSMAYLSLPGIGPAFAKRIINFRNKLGGFYSVDQVSETFGLADSTFQKIKPLLLISEINDTLCKCRPNAG